MINYSIECAVEYNKQLRKKTLLPPCSGQHKTEWFYSPSDEKPAMSDSLDTTVECVRYIVPMFDNVCLYRLCIHYYNYHPMRPSLNGICCEILPNVHTIECIISNIS